MTPLHYCNKKFVLLFLPLLFLPFILLIELIITIIIILIFDNMNYLDFYIANITFK